MKSIIPFLIILLIVGCKQNEQKETVADEQTQVQEIKKVEENIFCAVRMGGMGVAIGSLVGEDAAEMVSRSL